MGAGSDLLARPPESGALGASGCRLGSRLLFAMKKLAAELVIFMRFSLGLLVLALSALCFVVYGGGQHARCIDCHVSADARNLTLRVEIAPPRLIVGATSRVTISAQVRQNAALSDNAPMDLFIWASPGDAELWIRSHPDSVVEPESPNWTWLDVYSEGTYGNLDPGADVFNSLFRASEKRILVRNCASCPQGSQTLFYRRLASAESFDAYTVLLKDWRQACIAFGMMPCAPSMCVKCALCSTPTTRSRTVTLGSTHR
jgi:hypothetical protein